MDALIYFLIWAVLLFLIMRFGCGAHILGHGRHQIRSKNRAASDDLRWVPPETDTDPVCGKSIRTDRARSNVYDGYVYYFCSRACREVFEAAPQTYVGGTAAGKLQRLEHENV